MSKMFPELYKRTSTGKIQTWFGEVDGGRYRTTSGQLYGKRTTTAWTECEAKNVGRSNEVIPDQQAISEMESMYTKKRRTDYFDSLDDVDTSDRIKPMLALAPDKCDIQDDELFNAQPKFDGFRCIASKDGMFTREGLPFNTVPHIHADLKWFFDAHPETILDGEIYNHDLRDNFNKISSLLRDESPSPEKAEMVAKMQYYIYDLPSSDKGEANRREDLLMVVGKVRSTATRPDLFVFVDAEQLNASDIDAYLEQQLVAGYEGAILRRRHAKYQNKRTKDLIKVKKFLEEDFQLLDILPGRGNGAGKARTAVLQTANGQTFEAGIIGDDDYARELLQRKTEFIGSRASVKFLNYTPRGVPRGGKLKSIRFG